MSAAAGGAMAARLAVRSYDPVHVRTNAQRERAGRSVGRSHACFRLNAKIRPPEAFLDGRPENVSVHH